MNLANEKYVSEIESFVYDYLMEHKDNITPLDVVEGVTLAICKFEKEDGNNFINSISTGKLDSFK